MKLTADQKSRLVSLLARNHKNEALSESESGELSFLSGIAAQGGDLVGVLAEARAEAEKKPGEDESEEEKKPGEEKPKTEDPKAGPTVREKVASMIGGQPADLMAANRLLTAEKGRLTAELSQAKANLTAATARIEALEGENKILAKKDGEERQKQVASQVQNELAGVGQPESNLPATGGASAEIPNSRAELSEALKSLHNHREKAALIARFKSSHGNGAQMEKSSLS